MPVEVIGREDSLRRRKTCPNCLAILLYSPNDRARRVYWDYRGDEDGYYTITCPSCGKNVEVPE